MSVPLSSADTRVVGASHLQVVTLYWCKCRDLRHVWLIVSQIFTVLSLLAEASVLSHASKHMIPAVCP